MENLDWSTLPPELVEKIAKGITSIADYIRFRAVCKNWQAATPPPHIPCQIPWLMLPALDDKSCWGFCSENNHINTPYGGDFFSLSDNKVYHIDLHEARGKRCFGSSQGWLGFVEKETIDIYLLNPFTKSEIRLPPITTIPGLSPLAISMTTGEIRNYIWMNGGNRYEIFSAEQMYESFLVKFILSQDPSESESRYAVVIIYSEEHKMAFYRADEDDEFGWWPVGHDYICDVIYHKGQFYGVDRMGGLTVFYADPYDPDEKRIEAVIDNDYSHDYSYLVEASGDLFRVIRHCYNVSLGVTKTLWFQVYKFIPESEEWTRVVSLNEHALFLGMNCSFSLFVKDACPDGWCKPNCIYFTDDRKLWKDSANRDHYIGGHDFGIFFLGDRSIKSLPRYEAKKLLIWPPPMWITASMS